MISRLFLFICGIVFNLQVWGYAHDVVLDVSSYENIEIEEQFGTGMLRKGIRLSEKLNLCES